VDSGAILIRTGISMDHFKKERIISQISWGRLLFPKNKNIILYPPTCEDKAIASLIYDEEYKKSIKLGMMPEDELLLFMIDNNKWSVNKESKIQGIKDDIYKITRGLLDLVFNNDKLQKAKLMLRKAETALIELLNEKNNLLSNSAENYAMLTQQRYIIGKITKYSNGDMFWSDINNFYEYTNVELINDLSDLFFCKSRFSTKAIREIARSQPWRNVWLCAKITGNPFNIPHVEWTNNQLDLVNWSQTYDIAYDAYERPSKEVIDDDDLLDSWFIRQSEKIENKSKKDSVGSHITNSKKAGRQETFIMSDPEGSKKIYGANDIQSRNLIRAKQSVINKEGCLREQDAPDSQIEMRTLLNNQIKEKVKDIRRR